MWNGFEGVDMFTVTVMIVSSRLGSGQYSKGGGEGWNNLLLAFVHAMT